MLTFLIILSSIQGYTIKVSEKAFAPREVHDKCNKKEFNYLYLKCQMKKTNMECSSTSCGGEKFICDCNVKSYFFIFYDETKCRWEHERQEPCPISSSTTTTSERVSN